MRGKKFVEFDVRRGLSQSLSRGWSKRLKMMPARLERPASDDLLGHVKLNTGITEAQVRANNPGSLICRIEPTLESDPKRLDDPFRAGSKRNRLHKAQFR